jgi:hypothetical protein
MTLHDRIENWRRWVLASGYPYGQAMSLEGDYRSPQHWHPEGPRAPEVWRADAELLERAWTTVRPLESRAIIKLHHIFRLPEWTIRRRVRAVYGHAIGKEQLPGEIAKADVLFGAAIDTAQNAAYKERTHTACA